MVQPRLRLTGRIVSLHLLASLSLLSASRAAPPATLGVSGFLRDTAGKPVNSPAGGTPMTLSLYAAPADATPVWSQTGPVQVLQGQFTVGLGSTVPFPPGLAFDKPYWVGIKVGADPEMRPRLPLLSVPYALNGWSLGGNAGTDPAGQFLGTTDAKPLVLKSNGHGALRLEDVQMVNNNRSPNVIGGYQGITVASGMAGNVIAGGGVLNADGTEAINEIRGPYNVIAGGTGNFIDQTSWSVIGGGTGNIGQGGYGTIAGGQGNNTQGAWSFIGGGSNNYTAGSMDTIAGGTGNQATGGYSVIGGGSGNLATGQYASIAGGSTNQAVGTQSFVGSGLKNVAGSLASVGSGQENQANGLRSFIGAGSNNATATGYDAVIGAGTKNSATGMTSGILGGYQNSATGSNSAILGGKFNTVSGDSAIIGGGTSNVASASNAAVGGGDTNNATGQSNVIAGGEFNISRDLWTVVAGGSHNWAVAKGAFAGGGYANTAQGIYSVVPGGAYSTANNAAFAAGYRAKAVNTGSFVWSDYSADQDFASEADNQFCIRAKGGLVIESFGSPGLYTGQGTTDMRRYLLLLNSTKAPAASGLKAGGILCADSYDYASPGKNDMIVKGSVSIGFYSAGNYALSVNGNVYSSGHYDTSDARFKKDVRPLDDALGTVSGLQGVSFAWDEDAWKDRRFPSGRQVGFIAQDVEKVLPEAVSADPQGYKAVSYTEVVPVLVEAVKTLKHQNEDLAARNAALEAKLNNLSRAVAALQAEHR